MTLDKSNGGGKVGEDVFFGQNPDYIKTLNELCLLDDRFMTAVFEKKELAELLLRIVLNKPDLVVISSTTQYNVQNLYGRSVRLDIIAKDKENKIYNVEVQRDERYAIPRRARYNSSLIDAHAIESGGDISNLPETYIIFITEQDYFHKNMPLYKIERTIIGTDEFFNDGAHIIYVNGENRDNTDLGHLMADFACKEPDKFYFKALGEATAYFKRNEEGVGAMCKLMEDLAEKAARERDKQLALKLIAKGSMSYEEIAELTDLSVDEIKSLAEGQTA